jgi:hypothetical protein
LQGFVLASILTTDSSSVLTCVPSNSTLQMFGFSGGYQYVTVPAGAQCARVHMWGAGGANYLGTSPITPGGAGAYVTGLLAVTPGEQLRLIVGRAGGDRAGAGFDWEGGGGMGAGNQNQQSGGGRSALQRWNGSSYLELVTAGGGGSAGGNNVTGGAACWNGTSWQGGNALRTISYPQYSCNVPGGAGGQFRSACLPAAI